MAHRLQAWRCVAFTPCYPEARDQGDPYVLAVPPGVAARFRYYVYVTGEDAQTSRAFPAYGSNDLVQWEPLGGTLRADVARAHWAPCVCYLPDLRRPYVMLYSRGAGQGEHGHIGHTIQRAESETPEGPFEDSGHVLTPDVDFAIDPDVYHLRDGRLWLAFATDFVSDAPLGTGIVEAPVRADLTVLEGPVRVLARARYDWQVYDPRRRMPWKTIPGVNWDEDTVLWNTIEAPVGGLVSPGGEDVYLYSGGCFFAYYAIGAVMRRGDGQLDDVSAKGTDAVLRPQPEQGFFGPGHCSWFRDQTGADVLAFHARYGAPDAPRQMSLARLRWAADGRPYATPFNAPP